MPHLALSRLFDSGGRASGQSAFVPKWSEEFLSPQNLVRRSLLHLRILMRRGLGSLARSADRAVPICAEVKSRRHVESERAR